MAATIQHGAIASNKPRRPLQEITGRSHSTRVEACHSIESPPMQSTLHSDYNVDLIPPLTPVTHVRPVAPWVGGKRNLAGRICKLIDAIPHAQYCEPFVGMGGIFLRRSAKPAAEVINDRNGEVANLFRILQRHYIQLLDVMRFGLTTRAEFDRLVRTDATTLTDLERAARFIYLQRTAFGGKPTSQHFGVSPGRPARFDLSKLAPMLEEVHTRLSGVIIENLDWKAFIPRYDREGTLFYLDPPYWGCEDDYGKAMFGRDDFAALAVTLGRLKGRFVMSLNDNPSVRELFAAFHIQPVLTSYSVQGGGQYKAPELLIHSLDPDIFSAALAEARAHP
jgi:DNA adenine methylase